MKERIIQIMEAESLTPSLFADKLNVGRAVISHILNGRNNPSLDVVVRILDTMDSINADWLLSGKGEMRKSDNLAPLETEMSTIGNQSLDLFSNEREEQFEQPKAINNVTTSIPSTNSNLNEAEVKSSTHQQEMQLPIIPISEKKISKIIIYYSDNTFQAFNPDSKGL